MEVISRMVRILIAVAIFAACRSQELKSVQLSKCLSEPMARLVYRYAGPVDNLPHIKLGCYIVYGNGKCEFGGSHISERKFFLVDASGCEVAINSSSNVVANIFEPDNSSSVPIESQTKSMKFDRLCFPAECYNNPSEAHYKHCWGSSSNRCSATTTAKPAVHLTKVSNYDLHLFCSAGDVVTAFKPFDGVRKLQTGKISETSKPYLRYEFHATSVGSKYGCKIDRPLDSDSAFRSFYFGYNKEELNESSVVFISIGENGEMLPPQRMTLQDFCFPSNCYRPNEVQHCGRKIGKPYSSMGSAIFLVGSFGETRLLTWVNINKEIWLQETTPMKAFQAKLLKLRSRNKVHDVTKSKTLTRLYQHT